MEACSAGATSRSSRGTSVARNEIVVDLGALRRNVRTLLRALEGAELWAVVKADAYGHGAVDCAGAALGAGAAALCVATVAEALELRREFGDARMGRWGVSELPAPAREVVGLMTHLATADCDLEFARTQVERFRAATETF